MPSSNLLPQWLRNPSPGWFFHLLMAVIVIVTITLALLLRDTLSSVGLYGHYIIWFVTPVTMAMFLIWGQRAFLGVLVGSLIGFLPWNSWQLTIVAALDGTIQVSFGIFLVRRFWPREIPLRPSVRFFAILVSLGVMLPVFVLSVPTVWLFSSQVQFASTFWDSYFMWCISEISGVLIVLPPILMAIYPMFRKTLERPYELVLYIVLCIVLMVFSVMQSFEQTSEQIVTLESWMLVGTAGFIMIVRNGVGGIIISNAAMAAATAIVQILLAREEMHWITMRMLTEFNLYTCHLTGLTLIIAAGFYDHKMLNNISRDMTAKMLNIQVSERRRLAADLHDSVSQEFAAALMQLRSGVLQIPAAQQNESLQLAESSLTKGLQDLRQTAVGLRPELLEYGMFGDIIESYCNTFEQRHDIDVLFVNDISDRAPVLSLEKREHLFRVIQEALSNAVTHGKARTIAVHLLSNEKRKRFTVRIEDDGIGFDTARDIDMTDRPHLGLRLMQERTLIIGGTFTIISSRQKGTAVEIKVPFDNGSSADRAAPLV